jgi:very-short-patch-repair endonuclease
VKPYKIKNGQKYCSKKCTANAIGLKNSKLIWAQWERFEDEIGRNQNEIIARNKHKRIRKKHITCTCKECGRMFKAKRGEVSRRGRKYCSHKCSSMGATQKTTRKCLVCGGKFFVNPSTKEENGKFCSRECLHIYQTKRVTKQCIACGKKFEAYRYRTEQGNGKYCSRECTNMWLGKNRNTKDTDIEIILKKWMIENNIAFTQQYPTKYALVDFFILPNICLFADGDYWHTKDKYSIEKDVRQTKQLENSGYKVIRLWGSDIYRGVRPNELLLK